MSTPVLVATASHVDTAGVAGVESSTASESPSSASPESCCSWSVGARSRSTSETRIPCCNGQPIWNAWAGYRWDNSCASVTAREDPFVVHADSRRAAAPSKSPVVSSSLTCVASRSLLLSWSVVSLSSSLPTLSASALLGHHLAISSSTTVKQRTEREIAVLGHSISAEAAITAAAAKANRGRSNSVLFSLLSIVKVDKTNAVCGLYPLLSTTSALLPTTTPKERKNTATWRLTGTSPPHT